MERKNRLFTSESVTEGHPDKVCDSISDAVLDELLKQDVNSRCACETCATTNTVMVMGEITSNAKIDVENVIRNTIKEIGYTEQDIGFDFNCQIINKIHSQSADIAMGVDMSQEAKTGDQSRYDLIGAGDQGMMYGYACNETEDLMPLPITLAHRLTATLTSARKSGEIEWLRPDGKAQVTVEYDENNKPVRVHTVVVSTQHSADVEHDEIERTVIEKVIKKSIPNDLLDEQTRIFVNPTGRFVIGGPNGDSGLTGRKIVVDTYGGYCPHGGGAFSGKDPTKVDRSASYYARYVCKNIVASGLAERVMLEVSYAIGVAKPISLRISTFGTGVLADSKLEEICAKVFDFRPGAIIDNLGLRAPIYKKTTNYGHFGKGDLAWERTDKVDELKKQANI